LDNGNWVNEEDVDRHILRRFSGVVACSTVLGVSGGNYSRPASGQGLVGIIKRRSPQSSSDPCASDELRFTSTGKEFQRSFNVLR
jgi:hypothetical protein